MSKRKTAKKKEKEERERDKDTLCYFTPRADGSHTPQCLLEGCIDMETAITIGQVLQETDVSHVWTIYWCTTLKYIQTVFPNQKHQLDSRKSKSVLMHEIMWLFRYFHSTGLHKSTERTKDCVIFYYYAKLNLLTSMVWFLLACTDWMGCDWLLLRISVISTFRNDVFNIYFACCKYNL